MADFHSLTVQHVKPLTDDAVAITFTIPKDLAQTFAFTSGQYITIKKELKGKELRRAYSISSSPTAGAITIGVKKVDKGGFSDYANTKIKAGDVLEVMPPEGRFVFKPTDKAKNIAAFAAGSGITPIISIARTVLASNPKSKFVLVYGNKSYKETMFYTELVKLQLEYANRFFINFICSQEREENSLFGRIDVSTVNYTLKNKHKDTVFDDYFLCGPEAMINLVSDTLKEEDVPAEKIHFELFTATEIKDELPVNLEGLTQVSVVVDDEEFSFSMDKKAIVLDAVLKENIDAPYSCQGGVCSSCIARVTEGQAEMVKNQILTDSEIAEGLILTCQAHPTTPTLKVDYDDV
ncbi:ring-1,2-phenylacetyl-CoA epoxidase subunit PaaE [Arenibacter nanhaiticus]|uniref:Ring-1,2-phenylacetyl-CoA epoxidase subunit PaaE n=1 Tax=Arenibacter nanhaiticus TaxID=558155 RepID=A0A1M6A4S2_9FLAO|nr:ferredoxin--NADP reductase [Arenibacter nanhaiticus]SHI31491.1 ring-1,2-phenylacetyl-CoA epoxidase subunit PaaE [Arenibacter nanhaiticus]